MELELLKLQYIQTKAVKTAFFYLYYVSSDISVYKPEVKMQSLKQSVDVISFLKSYSLPISILHSNDYFYHKLFQYIIKKYKLGEIADIDQLDNIKKKKNIFSLFKKQFKVLKSSHRSNPFSLKKKQNPKKVNKSFPLRWSKLMDWSGYTQEQKEVIPYLIILMFPEQSHEFIKTFRKKNILTMAVSSPSYDSVSDPYPVFYDNQKEMSVVNFLKYYSYGHLNGLYAQQKRSKLSEE